MKYLPGQPARFLRLSHAEVALIKAALKAYRPPTPTLRRRVWLFGRSLPQHAPYEVSILAQEWEMLSQALRYGGINPPRGSDALRARTLYQKLRRQITFETEGDRARLDKAMNTRRRRLFNTL